MRNRKARRRSADVKVISWVWEDDDPAAPPEPGDDASADQRAVDPAGLHVYKNLLGCEEDGGEGAPGGGANSLDRTLANILVFADDCRAAAEWLRGGMVSHEDEQGRRAGERRRHLEQRGLMRSGKRFVRLCGQLLIDEKTTAITAARHCIEWWEETLQTRTLHFHKCDEGVRWEPCADETGETTRMELANPFGAPPAGPERDGRSVEKYTVGFSDEDGPTAERSEWSVAPDKSPGEQEDPEGRVRWLLSTQAAETVQWLAYAAETAADVATGAEDHTLRTLFPSLREIKKRDERESAAKRAAEARETKAGERRASAPSGRSVH